MWILATVMFLTSWDYVLFRPREIPPTMHAAAVALIFTLPSIRGTMAGVPPIGVSRHTRGMYAAGLSACNTGAGHRRALPAYRPHCIFCGLYYMLALYVDATHFPRRFNSLRLTLPLPHVPLQIVVDIGGFFWNELMCISTAVVLLCGHFGQFR